MANTPIFQVLDIIYDYKEQFSNMDYLTINNLLGEIKSQVHSKTIKDYEDLQVSNKVYKQANKHLNKESTQYANDIILLEDKIRQLEARRTYVVS